MKTLISAVILLCAVMLLAQQQAPVTPKTPNYSAIPADIAKQANPVKSSPESLARAKKWWTLDCAMCHGANGDAKTDLAKDMKLQIKDFSDPASLKDRTDGELFYIIKNGVDEMPPEGPRVKVEENWDLVNYVRAFSVKKTSDAQPEAKAQ